MTSKIILHHPIYSYLFIQFFVINLWWQVLRARCHQLFHKRGTLTPPAFKPIYPEGNVCFIWDIWALCAVAWVIIAECHLVKSLCIKHFYKLPKSRMAGKFQMCLHEQAVRSRWCLSPVLKCSVGTLRALCIHCVRVQAEACFVHGRHFGFASASCHY